MQTKPERHDLRVASARGRWQRFTKSRDRFGIAVSVEADQVFGLLLQTGKIRPIGQFVHWRPPCIASPSTRKIGCTKAQMPFDRCKRVKPFPRVRVRLAPRF